MIIAREPFLSWSMTAARRSAWTPPAGRGGRYRFFQARNAIYHSLEILGIASGGRILVPAYLCRAAIDPLVAYGLAVDFFAIRRDCSIDMADLEMKITPATRAIMIVHYFGFPQVLDGVKKLCARYGLLLIEDCAHILAGRSEGQPIGSAGDAAVFSWRKFLPIHDGADLIVNRAQAPLPIACAPESGIFTLKVAANMVETSLAHTRQPGLRLAYRAWRGAAAGFKKYAAGGLQKSQMMQAETSSLEFAAHSVNWPMSRMSRWTMAHCDIAKIVQQRRRNYEMLLAAVQSDSRLKPLFPGLPADVCPWVFPLCFSGVVDAHLLLRSAGIPAVTWGGVRHPAVERHAFADADFLYDSLVFLPLHQCLGADEMKTIVRAMQAVYR